MTTNERPLSGPACPECGGAGVPVVFGMPSHETYQQSQRGGFRIGGCVVSTTGPVWSCSKDHTWEGDDRPLWSAVLDAALRR